MLEWLQSIDVSLFRFINGTCANPVTDFLMPIITSDWNLRIAYVIAMIALLWKGSRETRWLVGFSILAMLIADQVSSGFLKELFGRTRPCTALDKVHLLVNCGAGKSMPSSHASNAFAQAVFFSIYFRNYARWLVSIACLIAISRVFVGVHYPFDVMVGAIVGCAVGIAAAWVNMYFGKRKAEL